MKTTSTSTSAQSGRAKAAPARETARAASWRWLPVAGVFVAGIALAAWLATQGIAGKKDGHPAGVEASSIAKVVPQTAATLTTPASTPLPSTSFPSSLSSLLQSLATVRTAAEKRALSDALIAHGSDEALQAWGKALLAETDPAARRAMLEALDTLHGEAAVEMITQLIELSDDPDITQAVTRTLGRMANAATIEYLTEIHTAAAADPARQQRVLGVLGAISNPAAVPGLIRLAHQPALGTELTGQAFNSLGKIGDSASLLAMSSAYESLQPENFAQRQQVLQAISTIRNPGSRAMLEDLAANSQQPLVAAAAADALRNLPDTDSTASDAQSMPSAQELVAK